MFKWNWVVKCVDSFGVEHAAKVEAESLFEAAFRGLHQLDSSFWTEEDVFDRMDVTVEVHEEPTTHTVQIERLTKAVGKITGKASARAGEKAGTQETLVWVEIGRRNSQGTCVPGRSASRQAEQTRVDSRPRLGGWLNANLKSSSLTTQGSGRNSPIVRDRQRPHDTVSGRPHKACLLPLPNCAESARACGTDKTQKRGSPGQGESGMSAGNAGDLSLPKTQSIDCERSKQVKRAPRSNVLDQF